MSMDLRPLSLGELLDRAFTMYRRHLWLLVGIMAVPSALGLVLNLLLEVFNRLTAGPGGLPAALEDPDRAVGVIITIAAGFLLALLAYFVVYAIALGAITLAVSELYQERPVSIGGVYGQMRPHFGRLIWLLFLMTVRAGGFAFVGLVFVSLVSGVAGALVSPIVIPLVIVPGMLLVGGLTVFMLLRWGVAVPALVLEDRGAGDAIRRSIELTRGRLLRVLALVVLATVITYAAAMLFHGPFLVAAILAGPETGTAFWLTILGTVSGTIGTTITGPLMIVGLALLYYDARIREEGLDLQLMMAALDEAPATQVAQG